jgi:hypothetical protein
MLAFGATAVGVVALTACGGGGNTAPSYIAPPQPPAQAGQITLSNTTSQQQLPTSGGYGGVISWPVGSGTVDTSLSTTAPSNVEVVTPSAVRRLKASAGPTVVYLTISTINGATLNGFPPGVGLTTPTADTGPWQEAEYGSTTGTWTNVETGAAKGDGVAFPGGKQNLTLAAGGSVTLAFYPGNYPEPTPTPTPTPEATPTSYLAQGTFQSGTQTVYVGGSPIPAPTTGSWTQCSITASASNAPVAINRKVSSYPPDAGATPAAVVMTAGTTVPVGTANPVPTQTTVPPYGSDTYAAVFGGVFSTYYDEDFAYNGLCQVVSMPSLAPTLTMDVFANGNDGATYADFEVDWLTSSGQFYSNLYEDPNPITGTSSGDTKYRTITVPSSALQAPGVGGTTGILFIGLWVDAGSGSGSTKYSTYYFVDNVNLTGIPQ